MPANTTPIFTLTPKLGIQQISTANTNRDGTGTISSAILTGTANGTRVHKIRVQAIVATTAGMVRLYIDDGVNVRLWREIVVTAITPSASVACFDHTIELLGERAVTLPSGYSLKASTQIAETFNVFAEGADF